MAQWRARSQVLVFWLIWLIPPYPPSGHLGLRMSTANACHGALGGPFFAHFFESILKSILDSFWVRFGLVLGSFWPPFGGPNRVKLDTKCILNRPLFENGDVQKTLEKPRRNGQTCSQEAPKIAPRPVQDGSKRDKKVMHFSS